MAPWLGWTQAQGAVLGPGSEQPLSSLLPLSRSCRLGKGEGFPPDAAQLRTLGVRALYESMPNFNAECIW